MKKGTEMLCCYVDGFDIFPSDLKYICSASQLTVRPLLYKHVYFSF